MPLPEPEHLAASVIAADKAAIAAALNLVEDRRPGMRVLAASLLARLSAAERARAGHRIGLTGPPGVGKSTLAGAVARELRVCGRTVGILAVDPSSPRSGGALLGDRVRMDFDPADGGLFVRSVATAGRRGGLSHGSHAAVLVLAAAYEIVIVETTGVGQSETDVEDVVDTVVLVVQPGSGDAIQFLKAGIMEIPDLLVVNKVDREASAGRAFADLEAALATVGAVGAGRAVPVVCASATEGTGVADLTDRLEGRRAAMSQESVDERRLNGAVRWTLGLFATRFGEHGAEVLGGEARLRERVTTELRAGATPLVLAEQLGAEAAR